MLFLFFLLVFLWFASGYQSFVYWWTKEFDFTSKNRILAIIISCIGPFAFLLGWVIYGDKNKVIKKKKS